jgi:NAD(P)H-dependent flavin oxidoreductase YrpB (nitropropane dioxygenase family)
MASAQRVLHGILAKTEGMIHGVTCGAGMPYRLSEIAAEYGVYYYPIVSSARALRALWKRAYQKQAQWLGGVVYEDPWLAGGHNGLSNEEDPVLPQDPYHRVVAIREFMQTVGLDHVPIIMAGGVWHLKDWAHWLDNPAIGPIAFQFGTRPLLTQESPIPQEWKNALMTLQKGDIFLNQFSPTGFYSSAVNNGFITELRERSARQVPFAAEPVPEHGVTVPLAVGARGRVVYMTPQDAAKAQGWMDAGYAEGLRTPDNTLIFVTPTKSAEILQDQRDCTGCLSACRFSNWSTNAETNFSTGRKADPRSYCIQKTLQDIIHGVGSVDTQLMFAGHHGYRFAGDPFYAGGYIPTIAALVQRILQGE